MYGNESLSTILNGCGRAKIDVGIYFDKSDGKCGEFEGPSETCEVSHGIISVNLNGKEIGSLKLEDSNYRPENETKVLEFTFHHGSKFEFLLSKRLNEMYAPNNPTFKFNSFKFIECFSKCE